ncbi:MAG: ASCH domain-containing protein [Gammaproteobacteria bacterium]
METLPKKNCSIERLVTQPRSVALVKDGLKTQQRRDGVYGWPGETFVLDDMVFVITELKRQRLSDMTEADARAEGFSSLESYKDMILKMHPGMSWNEDALVWVHSFDRGMES